MKNRIVWIDTAKGLLIILVVIGHCHINSVIDVVISSFHMAGFFIISGFTFNAKNHFFAKNGGFLIKKIKSIILPYFLFCFLMLLQKYFTAIFISHKSIDIIDGLVSVFVLISGRETITVYGLWFLPCIFLSEIILYFFVKIKENKQFVAYLYLLLIFIGCSYLYIKTRVVSVVSLLPFSCTFILIGKLIKKCISFIEKKKIIIFFISIVFFAVCVYVNSKLTKPSFDFSSMNMGVVPLYLLSSIFGTMALICISMNVQKLKFINLIGKNSIYYYGFHYEILALLKQIIPYSTVQAVLTVIVLFPIVLIYVYLKNKLLNKRKKHD